VNITFGIITDGESALRLDEVIGSIFDASRNSPGTGVEIIVVGGRNPLRYGVIHIPFNDSLIPGWITRKKNMITTAASYDTIVYMHDYLAVSPGFIKAFYETNSEGDSVERKFNIGMTQIKYENGRRFRDWCIDAMIDQLGRERMLPYDVGHLSKIMYISGSYWVAKRNVMCQEPLNEQFAAGQGEDIDWSHRVRDKFGFTMLYHPESYAICLKPDKPCVHLEMSDETANIVKKLTNEEIDELKRYSQEKWAETARNCGMPCNGR
jgi:hypothetical protein